MNSCKNRQAALAQRGALYISAADKNTPDAIGANGVKTRKIKAKKDKASEVKAKGFGASGIKASGVSANGVSARKIKAKKDKAKGFGASGVSASEVKSSGIKASGVKSRRVKAKNDKASGVNASRVNASRVNASGVKTKKRRFGVKISPLYLLMAGAMLLLGEGYEIVVYTVVVILHEMAHAEAAGRLGYVLHGFKLMPYGAQLSGGFEAVKRRDEILIAAAGPAFNLLLAVPAVALWWLIPQSYYITELFVTANLFTAIFNLLPVFPLDGGRIFLAALTKNRPRNRAYKIVRVVGFVFSGLTAGLFVLSLFYKVNFSFAVAALFMLASVVIPDKNSYYQRLYSMAYTGERLKRGLNVREIMVDRASTVLKLSRMLSGGYFTRFLIVGADLRVKMTLTETDLEEISTILAPWDVILNNKKLPAKFKDKDGGRAT